ncbi:peptide ABC transporter [Candidatus Atribacteria bacterium HGW-Atribacteria-1]|nr:MAG: peptide ABC transporter [Candidatus Atribacteria bacterium HGW-Atribacteria-1]
MRLISSIHSFQIEVKRAFKFLLTSRYFTFGFTVLVIFLALGFILSPFAPYDPRRWGLVLKDLSPSLKHPLGTTTLGQDVFWLMTYSIKNSIILGTVTATFSIAIAMVMGFLAGHLGRKTSGDLINMVIDSFCIIPGLPVLLILSFALRKYLSLVLIGLILSIFGWAWPAKQLRSIVLEIKERTFISTAVSSGLGMAKVFLREYMPFVLPWLMMQFLGLINWSIGMETTLGVFGLSTMEEATIGTTIYWAMNYQALFRDIWWWLASPVIIVVLLIISIYLVSINISEYLNPRVRLSQMRKERET